MALEKTTINDKIEILHLAAGYPVIQVRKATIIKDDGMEVSRNFHRHVVTPGDDITTQDADVQAIAKVVHTKAAKDAYKKHLAEQSAA